MAGVYHEDLQRVVFSVSITSPFPQGASRNYHDFTSTRVAVNFELSVEGLSPSTNYELHIDQTQTDFASCANNGGQVAGVEDDIPPNTPLAFPDTSGWVLQITTDSNGDWTGVFNPSSTSTPFKTFDFSDSLGFNFEDGLSPQNQDQMDLIFMKNTTTPPYKIHTDNGNRAWWDSIRKYNPQIGYTLYQDADYGNVAFVFFDRVVKYRARVTSTTNTDIIQQNYTNVSLGFAFEVGAKSYPQNSDSDFGSPQFTVPIDISADDPGEWTPVPDARCAQPTASEPFEYSDAIKEDFATAPVDNLQIHTLEIYCEEDPQNESYFICNDLADHTLTTEEGDARDFQAANFNFTLPQTNADGAPEMQIAISNINGEVFSYVNRVRDFGPIVVKYRLYLASDTLAPQTANPLTLYLSEVNADNFQVTGRVSFVDILNKSFPSITYDVANFPNIYS